jgi:glycosyltransferase involved in cell wall biosynthesis
MYKHIVLIGLNYQPIRSTGDKNYWVELVPLLARNLDRITILSVRKHTCEVDKLYISGCNVTIRYIHPKFLETPDVKYSRPRIFWRKGAFPSWLGVIEKKMNIKHIADELLSIYRKYPFDHIHLMDNFGPGNREIAKIARLCKASISVSAISYQGKNPFLYNPYLRFSYNIPNIFVASYSLAFRKKLIEIGLNKDKIKHIPWGVLLSNRSSLFIDNKNSAKNKLAIPINLPLFLWAGYIQQIRKEDFIFALNQAKKALNQGLDGVFYFAFKLETGVEEFEHLGDIGDKIIIRSTTVEEFNILKSAADIFYSPFCNENIIIAPPLTWIEIMSNGIPIVTTNIGGVEEIIEDGKNGLIARNKEEIVDMLFKMSQCYKEMMENCYIKVQKNFDIKKSAEKYLRLWGIGDYNGI